MKKKKNTEKKMEEIIVNLNLKNNSKSKVEHEAVRVPQELFEVCVFRI